MFELFMRKPKDKLLELDLSKVSPNPGQPRRVFEAEELLRLAESIRRHGVIQPISVRLAEDGFELIAGERRLRAARLAGLQTIPAIVTDASEQESSELALIENLQRRDLNFFEEAEGIKRLMDLYGLTQIEVADRLAKKQSTVANKLRLLRLGREERELILSNGLSERHARALLKLEEPEARSCALSSIILKGLNVSESERLIEQLLKKEEAPPKRMLVVKDIRVFLNTINHAVEVMQSAGIGAKSHKEEKNGYIEYVIKIPTAREKEEAPRES